MSWGMTESVRGPRFLLGHKKGRLCVMQNRRSQAVRCASIGDVRQAFSSRSINQYGSSWNSTAMPPSTSHT